MLRRRLHRLTTAFLVVVSVLFSQWAMARYVCPQSADADAMAAMAEAGQPCQGMDLEQPALCHEHAADPARTFEPVKLPALGQPAIVQVIELPWVLAVVELVGAPVEAPSAAPAPPDPIFLSTLRLRV